MNIKDNINKISWSFLDKMTIMGWGLVFIFQIRYSTPIEIFYFLALQQIFQYIFLIADGLALQGMIQFGRRDDVKKVNLIALILLTIFTLSLSLIFYYFRVHIALFLEEPSYEMSFNFLPILVILAIPRYYLVKYFYRIFQFKLIFFTNLIFYSSMAIMTFFYISNYDILTFNELFDIFYYGNLIAFGFSSLILVFQIKLSFKGSITVLEYFKFSFPITIQSIFHSLPRTIDVYIINFFFSQSIAGIYGSAKSLFRVFEEANYASFGLIYPAAVKAISNNDKISLSNLITKSISFLTLTFIFIALFLDLGTIDYLINIFLGEKYISAIPFFKVLSLAVIFMPLTLLNSIIMAYNKPYTVVLYTFIALSIYLLAFYFIGLNGNKYLIPLAYVIYNASLGLLSYFWVKSNVGFKIKEFFRAFRDIRNLILDKVSKSK